jgi:hypothetical protein
VAIASISLNGLAENGERSLHPFIRQGWRV